MSGERQAVTAGAGRAVRIRPATPADAAALVDIYAPYVTDTAISFETEVPTAAEFRRRMLDIMQKYPYLVAEEVAREAVADAQSGGREATEGSVQTAVGRPTGRLLGYAYAHAFVGRSAYDWSAELTIYLAADARGTGLGRRMETALERLLAAQHITNLYACIGWTDRPEEALMRNSAQFHAHMGYRLVGTFRQCGYKFGRWYDMIWMEKIIGAHDAAPRPVLPFSAVQDAVNLSEPL